MNILNRKFRSLVMLTAGALTVTSCGGNDESGADCLVKNDLYGVYTDRVVQGDFEAIAVSPTEITTSYQSSLDMAFSPIVEFRFSFNSRDNELLPGQSHYAIVGESDTVVYKLGVPEQRPETTLPPLSNNTKWTIRVDMNPVLDSFKEKGYFETATGDTIYADDFKGVWIAGNAYPLTWDFENLYGKDDRKFAPSSTPGIYELTLNLNPIVEAPLNSKGWKIDAPNQSYPFFSSETVLADALYNMAIDNIVSNIRPDETFRAGAEWDGVWTRDVAYSIYLSLAYLDPVRSMNSLKAKVKNDRIVQDTGTGGSWPVSSDRVVWAMAAWEIYKATGDNDWLKYCYNVLVNTLVDDEFVVLDKQYGLMHGEQSYLDWREQSYPKWMQPKDIFESMTLGTNIAFYNAYKICETMADEFGVDKAERKLSYNSEALKDAINKHLWMSDKLYYSEYLYTSPCPIQSDAVDNLGQSLAVIFDVADEEMASNIISKTPITTFGTTSIYPMIKNIKPYHNDAVWPFVQSYWNLAAAKVKNDRAVRYGLGALYRSAAMFGTYKELYVASNGDFRGTAVNSDKQLWSCAGGAAMIFRMYAGMNFTPQGIEFTPYVPEFMGGVKEISNFKYRNCNLTIKIEGFGNGIASFELDGVKQEKAYVPASLTDKHEVRIVMNGKIDETSTVNMQPVVDMPETPSVKWSGLSARLINFDKSYRYQSYVNGNVGSTIGSAEYNVPATDVYSMVFIAGEQNGEFGFVGAPCEYIPEGKSQIIPVNKFAVPGTDLVSKQRSKAYVEISKTKNTDIKIPLVVDEDGLYYVDVRYSNGNGPINTENKCAIRTLLVNGEVAGAIVMPQRGIGEWLSSGYSNKLCVNLNKGANVLQIKFVVPQNENMNGDVNTALLQNVRVIKK